MTKDGAWSRRNARRPAAITAAVITAFVLVAVGWWIRDQVVTSGGTWTPVLGLLLGGAGGALIGALGAWIVARENRLEAKRTRFHGDLRTVATEMHRSAELHMKQRRQQFASWQEVADKYDRTPDYVAPPDAIPRVDDTEPVYYAALALALTAGEATIAAAWDLYRATRNLDLEGLSYLGRTLTGSSDRRAPRCSTSAPPSMTTGPPRSGSSTRPGSSLTRIRCRACQTRTCCKPMRLLAKPNMTRVGIMMALALVLTGCSALTLVPNQDHGSSGCQNARGIGPASGEDVGAIAAQLIGKAPAEAAATAASQGHTVVFNVQIEGYGECW